jgi:hypothetical protein
MWFFTSVIALATDEEITADDENYHLESAYWAESNSCPWLFIFSSAAFSLISISCSQVTVVSRAEDLLVVVVREVWTDSRSYARLVIASSEVWRYCSAVCWAAFSSAKDQSTADQEAFYSDNTFWAATSCAVKATNPRNHKVSKENQRFGAAEEEWVPSISFHIL